MTRWITLFGFGILVGLLTVLGGCDLGSDAEDETVTTEIIEDDTPEAPDDDAANDENPPDGAEEPADDAGSGGDGAAPGGLPVSLSQVVWLHTDVSDWRQTANLAEVYIQGDLIHLNYNKSKSWPAVSYQGARVNANAWIFVEKGGTWYAGTWEWLRPGQTAKSVRAVRGDHIKASPLSNFVPRSGTQYGFMVSGLARTSDLHNVAERSNVVMFTWP